MYTVINILIVTNNAGSWSMQVSNPSPEAAWHEAVRQVVEEFPRSLSAHRGNDASPVFFSVVTDPAHTMEAHTIESCKRDFASRAV